MKHVSEKTKPPSKRNLVSYLNMKIEQMERKRNEKTA